MQGLLGNTVQYIQIEGLIRTKELLKQVQEKFLKNYQGWFNHIKIPQKSD